MATATRAHPADRLAAGRDALDSGDWAQARTWFEAALDLQESGEAYEGLGWAGWWLGDADLTIGAREQAIRAYRAEGSGSSAARVAAWLASDHREFTGQIAVGQGWLRRARRMLDGVPEGPDHGWVALMDADFDLHVDADPQAALPAAQMAHRIGREHGVPDLEALGLALEGVALVLLGDVDEAMARLDEASAVARAEDLQLPVSQAWALCCLVSACEGVGDFDRALQWCEAMRAFSERWGGRQILGVCRSSYGRVLAARGDWAAAESELTAAVEDLQAARPGMIAGGLIRLGELRARQGRSGEARDLFERAGARGLVGLGELALEDGDAEGAADAAERGLRRVAPSSILDRLPALELLARAKIALGQLDGADLARREAEGIAELVGTPYLIGRARLVTGELAAARGAHDDARRAFEDAVDALDEAVAPFDAAVARLELARALAALGRPERAAAEAQAAADAFAAVGAGWAHRRASAPLVPRPAPAGDACELTPRELEVLRLVAQGLSDAEIGGRLFLSPHTVHRHVANVRVKLRLPSRAAAVAHAAREGLL
jgi:ATP/maltotriose-dependent transcriptional regulator MalT